MALKVGELFASLSVDAKAFESGLSGAASTFAKTSAEISEMAKKTRENVNGLGSSIGTTATKTGKIVKDVGAQTITTTDKINDKIKNVTKTLGTVVAGAFTVKKALDLAWSGIQYNAQIEQLQTSFEVMSGSAEVAADTVQRLKNVGAATPYDLSGLAQTTQLLMNYGFSAEDAVDQLLMLGDIAQGDQQKLTSIATGYAQMSSAAKVNLQDIHQMINGGFNPLQEIYESTGESVESLYGRISKGNMDVLEITASIIRATSEGGKYFKSSEKQAKTFNGQLSTLKDNWKNLIGVMTKPLTLKIENDVFPKINEFISEITTAFEEGGASKAAEAVGEKIGGAVSDAVIAGTKRAEKFLPDGMKTLSTLSPFGDAGKEALKYATVQAFGDAFSGEAEKRLFDAVTDKTIWQGVGDIFYDAFVTNPVKWAKAGAGAVADAYDATLGKVKLPDWLMFDNSEAAKRQKEAQAQLSNLLDPFSLRETQRSDGTLFSAQKYFDNLRDIGADEKQIHELITRYESMFDTKIADGMANIEESRRAQTEAIKQYAKELYTSKGESALNMTDLELAFIAFFKSSQDGLADELSGGEKADIMRKALESMGGLSEIASSSSSSGAIIGENFSAGIAGGIRAGIPDIVAAATEAANAASAGTSMALDEHSPSRVGFGQGLFYVQGIANGITESVGLITDAVIGIGEIARRNLSIAPPVYGRYAQYGGETPDTSGAIYGGAHSAARSGFGADAGAIGNAMANALIRSGALSGDVLLDGVKVGRRTAKPVEATNNRRAMQTVSVRGRSEVTI